MAAQRTWFDLAQSALCLARKRSRRRDKPKSWIVKDSDLVEVASSLAVQGELGGEVDDNTQ